MYRILGALLVLVLCVGCGSKPPTQPTTPPSTSPGPAPSADPVVRVQVRVDDGTPRDAVASLSEVVIDASGSTGSGALAFSVDFGDGTVAASATAKHVYAASGTYTATTTVTDAQGRKASDTRQIGVHDATGSWFHASYVQRTRRVEVRRLSIDAQSGTTVRGSYRVTGDADRTFTGTLIPPRDIRMSANDGVSLIGTLPGRLNDDAVTWTLISGGDSTDGQRLDFRAIVGAPDATPPVADMKLRMGRDKPWEFVYGYTPGPIPGITPVQIDAGASRGTDLSYFLEFGDRGEVATTSHAARVVESDKYALTARVTVVDRFGRSDSRSRDYFLFVMPAGGGGDSWFTGYLADGALWMTFPGRSGVTYGAYVSRNRSSPQTGYGGSGTAVLSGDGDIRVTIPALGIEYRGKLTVGPTWTETGLTVVQYGGPDDGRT
jgi:PKD domain